MTPSRRATRLNAGNYFIEETDEEREDREADEVGVPRPWRPGDFWNGDESDIPEPLRDWGDL